MPDAKNKLYYGDNLQVLRDYIPDQSVDLIYLDPPFNSRQDDNVLFAEIDGNRSAAQVSTSENVSGSTSEDVNGSKRRPVNPLPCLRTPSANGAQ
jgi:site-specific DNA-methyltransferase (adenine-specific)